MQLKELLASLDALPASEVARIKEGAVALYGHLPWVPNLGPQTEAYWSRADELFYGGAAGGGKTDLILGLAMTSHQRTLILRREGTDLGAIIDRMIGIHGSADGYNGQQKTLRRDNRVIELGSCPHEKDKFSYQGQPHDLKCFDEITQFSQSQYTYIIGWNRTTTPGQRCRVVVTGNPPSTPEGEWVKRRWGAWLDKQHPNPAAPGELRYFATINGEDTEVEASWRGKDDLGNVIAPRSRTFIPARTTDNPFIDASYLGTLNAMPEPYRSQLLYGSFEAGVEDHPRQVIPTAWVRRAIEIGKQRKAAWTRGEGKRPVMTALGVDVAMGGKDNAVLAPVFDNLTVGDLIVKPGAEITDGRTLAGIIVMEHRDRARVHIDMGGGYGDAVKGHLQDRLTPRPSGYHGGGSSGKRSRAGLDFINTRTEYWWLVREMLDPDNPINIGAEIGLPDDERLVADLVAPTFEVVGSTIKLEPKEKLVARIGRSPDRGEAAVAALNVPPVHPDELEPQYQRNRTGEFAFAVTGPVVERGYAGSKR